MSSDAAQARTPSILLAEDFPDFMERLLGLLTPIGVNITSASDGAEAIDYVRELTNPLHLLVTDLDMPKRTGWHVIEAVRKHRGDSVPIIMQTGEATYPWVKVQARDLGIVLIHKPDIDTLLVPAVLKALSLERGSASLRPEARNQA